MRIKSRFVLITGGFLIAVVFYQIGRARQPDKTKKFYLDGPNPDSGYLDHVKEVFGDFSISRVYSDSKWDILWSHNYPFSNRTARGAWLKTLPAEKRVNKIPGSGFLSSKQSLAKIKDYKYFPKAFVLPSDWSKFAKEREQDPDSYWLLKSGKHRNIRVVQSDEILNDEKEKFIQKMISPPLLINGRKFDIGTYVVLAQGEPLRVFLLDEWLIRFCNTDYYPFDPLNPMQYVVGDDYTPIWEITDIKPYYENKIGMKRALFAYLQSIGINPKTLESTMENAIRDIWELQQPKMRKILKKYKNYPGQFFELFRMDWVIDEDANLFLLEVNMSPNLSSDHFPPNAHLYRYVLTNLFQLMSLGGTSRQFDSDVSSACNPTNESADCKSDQWKFCPVCLDGQEIDLIAEINREQLNKNHFKRISPSMSHTSENESYLARFQRSYIQARCDLDKAWC